MKKKFVALYPGSFNLSTLAHRAVGAAVRDLVQPDEVWYLVSPQNPHKDSNGMARFEDRVAMAKLNVCGLARLVVKDIEKDISVATGSTASVDTLRELIRRYPDICFAWIVGADVFTQFHTWKNYKEILKMVPLIVLPRAGYVEKLNEAILAQRPDFPRLETPEELRWKKGWLYLNQFPVGNINATAERKKTNEGTALDPARIHPNVIRYIDEKHLRFE